MDLTIWMEKSSTLPRCLIWEILKVLRGGEFFSSVCSFSQLKLSFKTFALKLH